MFMVALLHFRSIVWGGGWGWGVGGGWGVEFRYFTVPSIQNVIFSQK